MSWKIRTFALFMGLNLLPTLAAGNTTSDVPQGDLVDLTKAEIEQTFRSFSVGEIRGQRTARLYGTVFSDCRQHFTITVVSKDAGHVGWRIQDSARQGRDCMRGHQADRCTETSCESLSATAPTITAGAQDAVEAGIVLINPDADVADPNRVGFTSLTPAINFRSTIAAAHAEQADFDEEYRRRIRTLREQVRTCRGNDRELTIARSALRELVSEGDVNESAMDRIIRELDRKELRLLESQVRRARIDDLGSLADRVMAFANSHSRDGRDSERDRGSDYATAAAHLMRTIAMRYVRDRNADEDSFADARDVLEKALELEGLSDTNATRLQGYLDDLDVAETAFMCRSGDAFECQPAYQSMMAGLQQRTWEACNGWNIDYQRCQASMMQMQRAPGQIQQTFQQRQQMQSQLLAGGGQQGPQFGNPMGYQQNPFMTQSTMAMNPMGMSQYSGFNPTAALVMNGSGSPMMPSVPPMRLPVASI